MANEWLLERLHPYHSMGISMKEAGNRMKEFSASLPRLCDWCNNEIIPKKPLYVFMYSTCPNCGGWLK